MFIYNSAYHLKKKQINQESIKELVLKIQKYIYLASRECHQIRASKYKRLIIFFKKETVLIALYNLLENLKKKYTCQSIIVTNSLL